MSALVGFPRAPIYCASKAAVVQLTRTTAIDLAPSVRCNCYCPGIIDTPMARAFIDGAPDPAAQARQMVATQRRAQLSLTQTELSSVWNAADLPLIRLHAYAFYPYLLAMAISR